MNIALAIYCVPVSVRNKILHEGFFSFGFFRYTVIDYTCRRHNARTPMFSGGVQIECYKRRIVVACLQRFHDGRYLDKANESVDTVCVVNLNERIVKLFKDLGSIVVIRILDFLGEAVKVYIRKDISVDGLVILVIA